MNQHHLPLHPTHVHPLSGKPIRALWQRPDGRLMWPMMGGAEDDAAAQAAAKAEADAAAAKTAADAAAAAEAAKKAAEDGDLGFPKDTPRAQMSDVEKTAYDAHHGRKHEQRATEYRDAAGGKSAVEVKAAFEELEKLRKQNMTDHEKAVEDAKAAGRAEATGEFGPKAVKTAIKILLGDMPEADQDAEIDLLDLSKFLTDSGDVDTDKVRRAAEKIAPAGKGGERRRDYGAGNRRTDKSSGVAGGRALYDERHGGKSKSTSTSS